MEKKSGSRISLPPLVLTECARFSEVTPALSMGKHFNAWRCVKEAIEHASE